MRVIKIKNDSGATQTILGKVLNDQAALSITTQADLEKFRQNQINTQMVANQDLVVQDEDGDITDSAKAMSWLYADNPRQVSIEQMDPETGGLKSSPRFAPPGWMQQKFELEFETSNLNSIHEKDADNNNIGWASLKFYDGNDQLITDTSEANLLANCHRTDLEWLPNIDYMIKGGFVAQIERPNAGVYVWAQAVVGPFGPQGETIVGATFAEGGINMEFSEPKEKTGLDGVSGTVLYYAKLRVGTDDNGSPILVDVPPGLGSNKIRFVVRHSPGYKHRLQCIFDLFRA